MSDSIQDAVRRGLDAIDRDEEDAARKALDEALSLGSENDSDALHLQGMLAWYEGDIDRACGFLMQAVDGGAKNPETFLDCAEMLLNVGDNYDEAEATLQVLLQLDGVERRFLDQARLMLARIRIESEDSDPEEALELIGEMEDVMREHPYTRTVRAEAHVAMGKFEEAIADLQSAIESDPDEADYHYQLGHTHAEAGDLAKAIGCMKRVLELDLAESEGAEEPSYDEVQELRARLEEVFEELPDPLLRRVASAPITVQQRATVAQIEQGIDPRGILGFEASADESGTASSAGKEDTESGEGAGVDDPDSRQLGRIVIMRDVLFELVDREDDIVEELQLGLINELRRFFNMENLVVAEA